MSDIIRIKKGDQVLINDYKKSLLEYYKSKFDIDIFYKKAFDEVSNMDEAQLLFYALNQAICDFKYKINYND